MIIPKAEADIRQQAKLGLEERIRSFTWHMCEVLVDGQVKNP